MIICRRCGHEELATHKSETSLIAAAVSAAVLTTMTLRLWLLWFCFVAPCCFCRAESSPVIGILAQPRSTTDDLYIAASYVKWLEAGGARSIPIPYDTSDSELLDDLFDQIDAFFLPGGATANLSFAVEYMLDKAIESNRKGQYFPVWGTCLGFEFLVRHMGQSNDILQDGFEAENVSLPLEYVLPVGLYREEKIYKIVTEQNVTLNNHKFGLDIAAFWQNTALQAVWKVTSINRDLRGRPFVSTLEPASARLPFYGVQYHPEKNAFEYATYPGTDIPYERINHSEAAVEFSLFVARFVVDLARQTTGHAYTQPDRFPYVYTYPQKVGLKFEQIYIVPSAASSREEEKRLRGSSSTSEALAPKATE
jgi:gamma-glutamyl hydrolase